MNMSLFGCEFYFGRLMNVSGHKFVFKLKTKAHRKAEEDSSRWRRKAYAYYDELRVLESRMRALDPSFSEIYKPLDPPHK